MLYFVVFAGCSVVFRSPLVKIRAFGLSLALCNTYGLPRIMPKQHSLQQPTGLSFVAHEETNISETQRRFLVRRHAALASASIRKATIAAKQADKTGEPIMSELTIKKEKRRRRKSQPNLSISSMGSSHSRSGSITSESLSAPSSATSASPPEVRKDSTSPLAPSASIDATPQTAHTEQRPRSHRSYSTLTNFNPVSTTTPIGSPFHSRRPSIVVFQSDPLAYLEDSTTQWHVDYFLTHLAPEQSPSQYVLGGIYVPSRRAMREELWPMAQQSNALFWTLLLCASLHVSNNTLIPHAGDDYTTLFRQLAMKAVHSSLEDDHFDDALICAVAILAKCEGACGSEKATQTHLVGLKALLAQREASPTAQPYPGIVHTLINCSGLSPIQPTLLNPTTTTSTTPSLLPGLERLRKHLLLPQNPHPLLHALNLLTHYRNSPPPNPQPLTDLIGEMTNWPEPKNQTTQIFSPLSTAAEDCTRLRVLLILHTTTVALLKRLYRPEACETNANADSEATIAAKKLETAKPLPLSQVLEFASCILRDSAAGSDSCCDSLLFFTTFVLFALPAYYGTSGISEDLNLQASELLERLMRRMGLRNWHGVQEVLVGEWGLFEGLSAREEGVVVGCLWKGAEGARYTCP